MSFIKRVDCHRRPNFRDNLYLETRAVGAENSTFPPERRYGLILINISLRFHNDETSPIIDVRH